MKKTLLIFVVFAAVFLAATMSPLSGQGTKATKRAVEAQRLFEHETFGGNGRTCRTCHSVETGTVSPQDARKRFRANPKDPLFAFDGSDDGMGHGLKRILDDATILVEIPLPPNVRLANSDARSVILRRGIPTTLNTPALDNIFMVDGRRATLEDQAQGAIDAHTQHTIEPTDDQLKLIAQFQFTDPFFSSDELRRFARRGRVPSLPAGNTKSEKRGRRFFEDLPPGPDLKDGLCSACHSGPMLDQTNEFLTPIVPVPAGSRFQTVLVSELNEGNNPVQDFIFTDLQTGAETLVSSPDPGRALITGIANDFPFFNSLNAFKISTLRGVKNTAPYFHDNSAKTLKDVVAHYDRFFQIATDPDGPGPIQPAIVLSPQEQADIVAYMKLLD